MSMEVSPNASSYNNGNVSFLSPSKFTCQEIPSLSLNQMPTVPLHTSKIDVILDLLNQQNDSTFKFVLLYSDHKGPRIYTNEKCSTRVRHGSNFLETTYGSQLGPNWIQFNYSILHGNQFNDSRTDIAGENLHIANDQSKSNHMPPLNDPPVRSFENVPIKLPPISPQTANSYSSRVQCKTEVVTDFSDFWEVEPSTLQPPYHHQEQSNNVTDQSQSSLNRENSSKVVIPCATTDFSRSLPISSSPVEVKFPVTPVPQLNTSDFSISSTTADDDHFSQSFLHLVNKISSKEDLKMSYSCQV